MFKSTAQLLIAIIFILFFGCGSDSTDDSPSNSCNTPTNLTVNGYLGTTADLSWNSDNAANIYFEIQYGSSNFSLGDGVTVTSSTTNISLEGLETSVSYDVYLRKNCGAERSEWVGPVSFTTLCDDDGIYVGDLQFRSQGEINSFDWECYVGIDGNLLIGPDYPNVTDPITNFNALGQLNYIKYLLIYDNAVLENLNGLENLQEIGYLSLSRNHSLTSLQGLNNVNKIYDEELDAEFQATGISISFCQSLQSLEGLDSLTEVGSIYIREDNESFPGNGIESIAGLINLTSVRKDIELRDCNNLVSFDGFAPSLTNMEGNGIIIYDCINLIDIEGLNNIGEMAGLYLSGLSSLANLEGLQNVDMNSLTVVDCDSLINLIGIPNNGSVNNYVIGYNENLESLEGINIPVSIEGRLEIFANPNLTTLEHLSGLESVGWRIEINDNNSLTNLTGLEDLNFIDGPIRIFSNDNLNDFCALTNLAINGTVNGVFGLNGSEWPDLIDLQSGNCSN